MDKGDFYNRFQAAKKLLEEETTSLTKFNSVRRLIKGYSPQLDKNLAKISKILTYLEKLKQGEIIDLTLKHFPAKTKEEKKRKKLFLLLFKSLKELKKEVTRVEKELGKIKSSKSSQAKVKAGTKLVMAAKGPLGIITLAAVAIVGLTLILNSPKDQVSPTGNTRKFKVVTFEEKKIFLDELTISHGEAGCGASHYHARNPSGAKGIEGNLVKDPGGCGFGRVEETAVEEIEVIL